MSIWRCERLYTIENQNGKIALTEEPTGKRCGLFVTDDESISSAVITWKPFVCRLCKLPKVPCTCRTGYYTHCLGLSGCPHFSAPDLDKKTDPVISDQ